MFVPVTISRTNSQNPPAYQGNGIREYPSSILRVQSLPIHRNGQDIAFPGRDYGDYGARVQNIESRIRSLEALVSDIRSKLNNFPSQSAISADYNRRLVKLEEQMQALRDVLVELRNYLASKR